MAGPQIGGSSSRVSLGIPTVKIEIWGSGFLLFQLLLWELGDGLVLSQGKGPSWWLLRIMNWLWFGLPHLSCIAPSSSLCVVEGAASLLLCLGISFSEPALKCLPFLKSYPVSFPGGMRYHLLSPEDREELVDGTRPRRKKHDYRIALFGGSQPQSCRYFNPKVTPLSPPSYLKALRHTPTLSSNNSYLYSCWLIMFFHIPVVIIFIYRKGNWGSDFRCFHHFPGA